MSATSKATTNPSTTEEMEREVLFQKIGHLWYAFACVDEEVIYTALPSGVDPNDSCVELYEVLEEHLDKVSEATNRPYRETVV